MNYERLATEISSRLSDLIERRDNDLLGITNVELVSLFWKTGKQVADYLNAGNTKTQIKPLVSDISDELTLRYGKLFSKRNVAKMKLFAEHFPNISVAKDISRLLSWQHILILLRIKDLESKWFYVDITIRQGLSPDQLLDAIRNKNSQQDKSSKFNRYVNGWNDEWWGEMFRIGVKQQALIRLMSRYFFGNYRSADFRKLLTPSIVAEPAPAKTEKGSKKQGVLFELIQEIEEFRKSHNWWLNGTLNSSFRQIGECINAQLHSMPESINKTNLIDTISKRLTTKYGSNFTTDQLLNMMHFFQNVLDSVNHRIAYLVPWEHLLAILPLREPEEQLFYARLAAKEGLSATILRERVSENTYLKTPEAEKMEKSTMTLLQNPRIITKNVKSKSKPLVIEHLIDTGDDLKDSKVIVNILENRYFPLVQS
ncbi:DUF1016 domain-containing protein [Flavihumibacter sp. R14]|nr:DUF1016 domain-containing protein [Flavihumibacter soli]